MTTGKTIALTRWTFVGKVMSLLFNMLSRLVITFLPRSKHLLISWLQSPSVVILEPPKIKSDTVSTESLDLLKTQYHLNGLPWWLRRQRIHLQCGRPGFDPWVGKIPWRRKWQSTPVFLPGESPWTEEPGGHSPWVTKGQTRLSN